jgi:small subunit ribosomal protein S30e
MGKVHGSLSRAGKVRNQTKKSTKKIKSKRKTGRAKIRIKFKKSKVIGSIFRK